MNRIEFNVQTKERRVIELTQAELDDAIARTAAEQSENAARAVRESDSDYLDKRLKAILRLIAQYHGKSGPEIRADYKAIWDSMP